MMIKKNWIKIARATIFFGIAIVFATIKLYHISIELFFFMLFVNLQSFKSKCSWNNFNANAITPHIEITTIT